MRLFIMLCDLCVSALVWNGGIPGQQSMKWASTFDTAPEMNIGIRTFTPNSQDLALRCQASKRNDPPIKASIWRVHYFNTIRFFMAFLSSSFTLIRDFDADAVNWTGVTTRGSSVLFVSATPREAEPIISSLRCFAFLRLCVNHFSRQANWCIPKTEVLLFPKSGWFRLDHHWKSGDMKKVRLEWNGKLKTSADKHKCTRKSGSGQIAADSDLQILPKNSTQTKINLHHHIILFSLGISDDKRGIAFEKTFFQKRLITDAKANGI